MKQELKLENKSSTTKNAKAVSMFLNSGSLTGSDFIIASDLQERKGRLIKIERNIFEDSPLRVNFKFSKKK